jgi:hypothetical protein
VASARDDAVPESDELLLEVLAAAVLKDQSPTSGELLRAARQKDEATFKLWGRRLSAPG